MKYLFLSYILYFRSILLEKLPPSVFIDLKSGNSFRVSSAPWKIYKISRTKKKSAVQHIYRAPPSDVSERAPRGRLVRAIQKINFTSRRVSQRKREENAWVAAAADLRDAERQASQILNKIMPSRDEDLSHQFRIITSHAKPVREMLLHPRTRRYSRPYLYT